MPKTTKKEVEAAKIAAETYKNEVKKTDIDEIWKEINILNDIGQIMDGKIDEIDKQVKRIQSRLGLE